MKVEFNRPYITGKEIEYINCAISNARLAGNGHYTRLCQEYLSKRFRLKKCLLTNSCTDALEMAAILLNIKENDEVIMPSYTFVSTANAFVLRGAKIVFADSTSLNPNIDPTEIQALITSRTKAIVIVHYAGISCDMNAIMNIAKEYGLFVVEDAAHAIDSVFVDKCGVRRPLGSIGHLATFSYHETKNITAGEGGLLVINDEQFIERAEIIWEKGTNRCAFMRGEINKYSWVDIGSSFLLSEINAAFLWAQLECLEVIQNKRRSIWNRYDQLFERIKREFSIETPFVPEYSTINGHIYYIVCNSMETRMKLMSYLKSKGISTVFHYQGLHNSPYYKSKYDGPQLINSDKYTERLLRLPLFYELKITKVELVVNTIGKFYRSELSHNVTRQVY